MSDRKRAPFSISTAKRPSKRIRSNSYDRSSGGLSKYEGLSPSELIMKDLISACRSTLPPHHEGNKILDTVEKLYSKASKDFVNSDDFMNRVKETAMQVRHHPATMFVITKDLFNDIKAYKTKEKSEKEVSSKEPENKAEALQKDSAASAVTAEQESADSESAASSSSRQRPSTGQISRLESILAAHHKAIEAYERKELSLDDLDKQDNDYLITERLKKRAAKIYLRLCELKGRSTDMGGTREKKFKYSGSRYNEVNIHIQRFINKHNLEERMPDYSDVRRIVKKCNEKFKYRLNARRVDDLSKEVFTEVGGILSNLRKKDFMNDFGPSEASRMLHRQTDDPAFFDSRLQATLKKNKDLAESNLKREFQKWADLDEESQNKEKKEDEEVLESPKKNGDKSETADALNGEDTEGDDESECSSSSSSSDEEDLIGNLEVPEKKSDESASATTDKIEEGSNNEAESRPSSSASSTSADDEGGTDIADLSMNSDSKSEASVDIHADEADTDKPEVIQLNSDSD